MNKLLVYPIFILFILSLVSMFSGETFYDEHSATVNYTGTNIPDQIFDIFGMGGIIGLILAAVGLSTVMGLGILGSGFSTQAQRMVFSTMLYVGIWMILSVICDDVLFSSFLPFTVFWLVLTMVFVIGFGLEMSGAA